MSIHQLGADDDSIDPETFADRPYPDPEWTPKQQENWDNSRMSEWFDELETDIGQHWAKRIYRPKKRNDGIITRDHVQLGTPEDYIKEHVDQAFDPWGSFHSMMMRELGSYKADKDKLETAIEDIIRAKLRVLAEHSPQRAERLLKNTEQVAKLYGVSME